MIRKRLTILSLIGLLLSVGLWAVSVSGGWSFTHFYMGPDGEATWLAFICAGGRIGWAEATDMMSRSLLRPDHGVSLWLPTVVLAGLFLFSIFQTFWERVVGSTMRGASRTVRRVGMILGLARAASTLRKKLTLLSLIGLLLSVALWGASYMRMGTSWRRTRLALMNGSVHLGLFNRGGFMELEEPEHLDTPAELDFYSWPDFPYTKTWCMGFEDWRTYSWSFSYERWMYGVNIRCPLWMPCLLFAATPLYVFAARPLYDMIPFSHRRKRKKLGLCLKCGYDLRGSKDRCPECGGEFSATPTELVKVQSIRQTRFKMAVIAKLKSFGGFCVCVALCYVGYAGGTWIFGPPSEASLGYTVLRRWTPYGDPHGYGAVLLLNKEVTEQELIADIKQLSKGRDSAKIIIYEEESSSRPILDYSKNQFKNEIQWVQFEGKRFGTTTSMSGLPGRHPTEEHVPSPDGNHEPDRVRAQHDKTEPRSRTKQKKKDRSDLRTTSKIAPQLRTDLNANTKIAFVSRRDRNREIYVMNIDGTDQTNLTNKPSNESQPNWSPDGKTIAYVSLSRELRGIFVMDADGSNQTRLTNNPALETHPVWSPDGKQILFLSKQSRPEGLANAEIYIMNPDGTNQRNVTNSPDTFDFHHVWSPDGKQILFGSGEENSTREICVMDADGRNRKKLTNNDFLDFQHSWSPDGKTIVFTSHEDGNKKIYTMNADGSDKRKLTHHLDCCPVWSPDGKQILFSSYREGVPGHCVMNADGTDQRHLAYDDGLSCDHVWSPDSKQIVFTAEKNRIRQMYIINADGSDQSELTSETHLNSGAVWSPAASPTR